MDKQMRWSAEKARDWYAARPRPLGCNFIPSTAGNQLEMWAADRFDRPTLARELDWAAGLGMNALRVFLHDLAFSADPTGFLSRVDEFLALAAVRGLSVMPVLFDDCWREPDQRGLRAEPRPGSHNSIWLRSPGLKAARDPAESVRLEAYVRAILRAFGKDRRVLAWDVYNEAGNYFLPHLSAPTPARQWGLLTTGLAFYWGTIPTLPLLRKAFAWCRAEAPEQPLTSAVYIRHRDLNRELLDSSDIVSFHNYRPAAELNSQAEELAAEGRPLLCTEYLARAAGCRFETCLPVFEKRDIGCFNWGLVSGRTQTIYSWSDRAPRRGPPAEPTLWYHDILRADGAPFDPLETAAIRAASARLKR